MFLFIYDILIFRLMHLFPTSYVVRLATLLINSYTYLYLGLFMLPGSNSAYSAAVKYTPVMEWSKLKSMARY